MLKLAQREIILSTEPVRALRIWQELCLAYPGFPRPNPDSPAATLPTLLADALDAAPSMDQAQVASPFFRATQNEDVQTLEHIVGRPITKPVPRARGASPAALRASVSRTTGAADNRVIAAIVPNPKKPGSASHLRFALYEVGLTVDQCIAKGLTKGDIKWDSERSFITFAE